MVFITLGTQGNQFQRCLKMVEELIDELHPKQEFVAQLGNTKYKSDKIKCLDFVPEAEFKELIGKADIVITHAGSGALFSAIKQGKKAIAEPLKPDGGTVKRYQPDAGRKPVLRRYPDAGSGSGECFAGIRLCDSEGPYGDLCG